DADVAEDAAAASAAPPVTGTASGAYHLVKRVPLPGDKGWDYCLADSEARRLYITHGDQLLVLDLDSAKLLGKVGGMLGIHGVAVARDLGRGYVSDGKAGSVACFDLRSLSPVASIVARPDVDAIVYEPGTQQVFAFSGDDQSCTVIDAPSNAVVATIDLGGKPEFAAVDNDTTVYVNLVDTDELLSIDAKTRTILRRRTVAPGSKPSSLVYDADGDNLFIGCRNGQAVVMGAASGLTKAAFAIGQRVDAAAYDAQQRLAFHSCGDGTVSVLRRESDGGFTPLPALATKKGSRTMALDQKTHRLYLPAADFGPEPSPSADQPHPRPSMVPGSFSVLIYGRDAK
ncbi:MAG TPA: YncE family protein, partial [bacterium]|nr:YncE family protein [bacterium]